jgi:hypothetical protein
VYNDVAAISLDGKKGAKKGIIFLQLGEGSELIRDRQPAYDPLHLLLLFVHGELGWH